MENREAFLLKSISYNVISQIFFRLLSFVLNAVLLRYVSTDLIGVCNFRLALLYTTVMFLSREPFRRALPSFKSVENDWAKFVNTLWLVVPNGIILSSVFGFIWYALLEHPNKDSVPNYSYAILICCIAFIVELCGEAANLISQMLLIAKQKVVVEASSLLIFHLTFVSLSIFVPSLGAVSYSIARLVYSIIFLVLNIIFLLKHKLSDKKFNFKDILPQLKFFKFDKNYLNLIKVYYTQSIYKQILTEGERYLITMFNLLSFSESGIYEIINNLGSLIARFIFLPIEEASYTYFTNSLERGVAYKQQIKHKESYITPKNSFENLLKFVSLIGITVLVYGQSYSQLLLQIYGGDKLGQNEICVNMLRLHCVYVLLLAINGVTESFFNATMDNEQLAKNNNRLIIFSVLFLLLANGFSIIFGIYGFLLANCVNMIIRIYYSIKHIKNIFAGYKYEHEAFQSEYYSYDVYKTFLPEKYVLIILFVSLICTKLSEFMFVSFQLLHLLIGAIFFLITLFFIYQREFKLKNFILKFVKNSKSGKD